MVGMIWAFVGIAVGLYCGVIFVIALVVGRTTGSGGTVMLGLLGLIGLVLVGWGVATGQRGSSSKGSLL